MSALEELEHEITHCTACALNRSRTRVVPGEGPPQAEIMFIGEGPGVQEDREGRPFVGPSGHLLEEWLGLIGLTRQQVYIANIVKCRPPENRDPLPEEVATCADFLERQIALIDPRLIATLGRHAMERFFPGAKISQAHGHARREGCRVYLPLYHPAYILRNRAAGPAAEADFLKIPRLLARLYQVLEEEARAGLTEPPSAPETSTDGEPRQLKLF